MIDTDTTGGCRKVPAMYIVPEIAERLRVSVSTVYFLMASGQLRHYTFNGKRSGGTKRCSEEQLSAYLASCERGGASETAPAPRPRPLKFKHLSR